MSSSWSIFLVSSFLNKENSTESLMSLINQSHWSALLAIGAVGYLIYFELSCVLFKKLNLKYKHCYITGGSQGLGKALAMDLARRGAHVTIVARRKETLEAAVKDIQKCTMYKDQKIQYVSADISDHRQSVDALKTAKEMNGKTPELIFTVAGYSRPGYLLELDHQEYEKQMQLNYMGTVYTVQEGVRQMVNDKVKGKVIMVSSVAGLVSFVGYSAYSPTKAALRGFAEALRSELIQHEIGVHIYFPGTIDSPGLVEEDKTKPPLTKTIEGEDKITPEYGSKIMLKGLDRNYFMITSDFIGDVCRATSACACAWNNIVLDAVYFWLSVIIFPVFRTYADVMVMLTRKQKNKSKQE